MSNNFEILTEQSGKEFSMTNSPIVFPFKPDGFQLAAFDAIEKSHNVLVCAPTSSGKTAVGEYAIAKHLKEGGRIIYTSPIKSLSNEKYSEFKEKDFMSGYKIGLLTGDNKIDVDSPCLIATAEILRNSLFKQKEFDNNLELQATRSVTEEFVNSITCVIMDEVHFINDLDRGKVWEETLILLDQKVQIIMLSATVDKPEHFAKWIGSVRDKKVSLIYTTKRIVPLRHYLFTNKLFMLQDEHDQYYPTAYGEGRQSYLKIAKERELKHKSPIDHTLIDSTIKFLKENDMLQAIFFSFSRLKCEQYAESLTINLITYEERKLINELFDKSMTKYKSEYEFLPEYIKLRQLMEKGVAYHHSGLLLPLKEIVEIIFKHGLIKVLFATETFAVGVNMPTRSVVFTELSKFTRGSKRFLNTAEYKQMAGRAGRRGKDTNGNVILLSMYEYPDELDLKHVMLSSMPSIKSQFRIDYQFVLKTKSSSNVDQSQFFEKSLLNTENLEANCGLIMQFDKLQKEKRLITVDSIQLNNFEEYYKKTTEVVMFGNVRVTLSKQQQKRILQLKNLINEAEYTKFVELKTINKRLEELEKIIGASGEFLQQKTSSLSNILYENNFINSDGSLTLRGIIGSQINECNCLLLTELITSTILDDMSPEEIVGLLSIFSSFSNNRDFHKPTILNDKLRLINELIDGYKLQEEYFGAVDINQSEQWDIVTEYIDISYAWAKGQSVRSTIEQLHKMNEHTGNFVKNMLKIYNLTTDLTHVAKMIKKMDLVLKLEKIPPLVLRDIVNVNSLYL